jgi:hypothetical protein
LGRSRRRFATPATQVHDINGGILASGLFWSLPAHERELQISRDGRRAVLDLRDVAVVDSFQFFGPNPVPRARSACTSSGAPPVRSRVAAPAQPFPTPT